MPSQAEVIEALRNQALGGVDPLVPAPQSPADPGPISNAIGIPDAVRALTGVVSNVASLPKQIMGASEQLRTTGDYNPQPAGDAMLLAAGGLPGAEAGAAGVFGGRLARSANLKDLDLAQAMQTAGHSPEQIYDATKWFQGKDSKWRFEIPDTNASMSGTGGRLGQLLDHPELMQQYPDLRGVPVDFNYRGGVAYFDPYENKIGMNATLPTGDATDTGLHEIQHWIQHHEGFSPGTSPRAMLPIAQQTVQRFGVTADPAQLALEAYMRHAGEVEARNVQTRFGMGATAKDYLPWETEDRPRNLQILPKGTGVGNQEALKLMPRTLLPTPSEEVREALAPKGEDPAVADYYYGSGEPNGRSFDIANDQGQKVARMWTAQHNPNSLYVNYIAALDPKSGAIANAMGGAANALGTKEMRSLIPELKKQFPDVNTIGGYRVSGTRAANPSSTTMKLK